MHEQEFSSDLSFIPFIEQIKYEMTLGEGIYMEHFMLNQSLYLLYVGLINADELIDVADADLRVVTDNVPFFYLFDRGIPLVLTLLLIFSSIAMIGGWSISPGSPGVSRLNKENFLFAARS